MQLSEAELRDLYDAVIRTSGHPDPLGYLARALILSGGDPAFVSEDGRVGFMPIRPEDALLQVGAPSVYDLNSNIIATMAMEIQRFAETADLEAVMRETSGPDADEVMVALAEARTATALIVDPPRATVADVIDLLNTAENGTLNKERKQFFERLANGPTGSTT